MASLAAEPPGVQAARLSEYNGSSVADTGTNPQLGVIGAGLLIGPPAYQDGQSIRPPVSPHRAAERVYNVRRRPLLRPIDVADFGWRRGLWHPFPLTCARSQIRGLCSCWAASHWM